MRQAGLGFGIHLHDFAQASQNRVWMFAFGFEKGWEVAKEMRVFGDAFIFDRPHLSSRQSLQRKCYFPSSNLTLGKEVKRLPSRWVMPN